MKTVLLVPGFQEDKQTHDYHSVLRAIDIRGYRSVFVPINWKRTTIHDWVKELEAIYHTFDRENVVLAGFSYGSMTALVAASHRVPSELWLFSLSPYFLEDIPLLKPTWLNSIGKRRTAAFQTLHFDVIAKTITCPTLIISGETENDKYPLLRLRSESAHSRFVDSRYIVAASADHDITQLAYITAIQASI